jgi:hypothetical protein
MRILPDGKPSLDGLPLCSKPKKKHFWKDPGSPLVAKIPGPIK